MFSWIKLKIIRLILKFISPHSQKHKFVLAADKLQSIFTITELKKYEIYPSKVKKRFYFYANAVTFAKLVENDFLKGMIFSRDIDISQVEFMLPL